MVAGRCSANTRSRLQQPVNTSKRVNESPFQLQQLGLNVQSGSWRVLEQEEEGLQELTNKPIKNDDGKKNHRNQKRNNNEVKDQTGEKRKRLKRGK